VSHSCAACSCIFFSFFFSSRRRHTRSKRDWSSDVCSSDLAQIESNQFPPVPEVCLRAYWVDAGGVEQVGLHLRPVRQLGQLAELRGLQVHRVQVGRVATV